MPSALFITVLAPVPSPYQVELFNALAAERGIHLHVVYLLHRHRDRLWDLPEVAHTHTYWEDGKAAQAQGVQAIDEADLTVFSYYADSPAQMLIRRRAQSHRPWIYWGERPGCGGWGWLGKLRRRFFLAPLHQGQLPIWGMGKWAVDGWRKEFGEHRHYENVPYFSDLERFLPSRARMHSECARRFLFSGSLIRRKGVDLLAEAFATVASSRPHVQLDVVGAGNLEPMLKRRLASAQVRFHGFCQWRDLPARYHDADILVAPSRHDGWGLVVTEGLAAGLPVISTDRTGAAIEFIIPGQSGWLVPAGDARALSLALAEAADLPRDKLCGMSAAAQASMANHSLAHGVQRFTAAAKAALSAARAA